jgi:putative transposase
MIAFIDDHRAAYGVEPICRVLPIAPRTYHADAAKRADPGKLSARARRDAALQADIRRVWEATFQVYGVRKVWRQLQREAVAAPRCQVARLMKRMGLAGAVRGKTVKTTHSDRSTPCPLDRVNRQFRAPAPNVLWVSDFTYVATWQGFVYVAFVIDAFARRIVGWRVSRSARADFVLDALEQALYDRHPVRQGGLVHHSDRGVQGGFKWSSQHHDIGGFCDEDWSTPLGSSPAARTEAVTWPAGGGSAWEPSAVLASDRRGPVERGRGHQRRRVAAGRNTLVPGGWWHATIDACTIGQAAVGAVSVVRGTRGNRPAAGAGPQSARDRPPAWPGGLDDLAGTAAQRGHAQWRPGVPRHHGPMACRASGATTEGGEAFG